MAYFEVRVKGVPCCAQVVLTACMVPAATSGHPDTWEPACPGEYDIQLFDLGGRHAPWLEEKLGEREHQEIMDTYFKEYSDEV